MLSSGRTREREQWWRRIVSDWPGTFLRMCLQGFVECIGKGVEDSRQWHRRQFCHEGDSRSGLTLLEVSMRGRRHSGFLYLPDGEGEVWSVRTGFCAGHRHSNPMRWRGWTRCRRPVQKASSRRLGCQLRATAWEPQCALLSMPYQIRCVFWTSWRSRSLDCENIQSENQRVPVNVVPVHR